MKQYELVYILHPDLEGNLEVVMGNITKMIGELEGRVLSEDVWGKRRLAYPIRKLSFGVYVVVTLEFPAERVSRLERELGLMDEVIRHLLVAIPKPRKRPSKSAKPKARAKEKIDSRPESERLKDLDEKLKEVIGGSEESETAGKEA